MIFLPVVNRFVFFFVVSSRGWDKCMNFSSCCRFSPLVDVDLFLFGSFYFICEYKVRVDVVNKSTGVFSHVLLACIGFQLSMFGFCRIFWWFLCQNLTMLERMLLSYH